MKKSMFSVYDIKAKTYCAPFIATNNAVAIRDFSHAANHPDTPVSQYPSDYILYKIGDFNDETGELMSSLPHNLGRASDYIVAKNTLTEMGETV